MSNLKEILKSPAGLELRNLLQKHYDSLKDISNIKDRETAVSQALEVKAHKKACEVIKDILEEIMTVESINPVGPKEDYSVMPE